MDLNLSVIAGSLVSGPAWYRPVTDLPFMKLVIKVKTIEHPEPEYLEVKWTTPWFDTSDWEPGARVWVAARLIRTYWDLEGEHGGTEIVAHEVRRMTEEDET